MAKKPSITTVSSGYQATTTINDNLQNLRNAFDNTLSLDGSVPNAMGADLDMNSNDILNVNSISADELIIDNLNLSTVVQETAANATAAATSATSAAASYDSFDDRYLGPKATAPTLDNDGNALLTGALYWNTTSSQMFVRSSSSWINYEATSVASASTATTQAGIATTQAGIATTQAGLATTAKTQAEAARDAAFGNANVYPDTAAGLAAVTTGQQFMVVSGDQIIRYQENAGPVAAEVARFPAMPAITGLRNDIRSLRYGLNDFVYSSDVPDEYVSSRSVLEGSTNVKLSTTADAGGNKVNTDGTITVGAGSYVEYTAIGVDTTYDPDGYYYIYLAPVDATRADDLSVTFRQTDAATANLENSVDRSQHGLVKVTYRNRNISGGTTFANIFPRFTNNGATALTMVWPSLTRVDDARIGQRMQSSLGVPNRHYEQEIRTFEFWENQAFFDLNLNEYLRSPTVAVDSVAGNDANAGTRFAPKQTLGAIGAAGSLANGAIVALRRGSLWREQLAAYFGSTAWDASFVADDRNKRGNMPRISSFKPVVDGDITNNGDGTYTFTFQPNASSQPVLNATMNNGYNILDVREVNTALDASGSRFAARWVLKRQATLGAVQAASGQSFASYNSGTNTWTVTFSPRAGVTPKDGTNTYEVISQSGCIIQANGATTEKNATFIGLDFDGAAAGYGMITGGSGSLVDFCCLSDGNTHHSVMASMVFQRSLITSRGNTSDSIAVSYSIGDNTLDTVTVYDRNFIFAKGGPYAHNNVDETKLAKAMIVSNQYFVGDRDPVTNGVVATLGTADQTDNIIRRFNYAKNILSEADRFATTFIPNVVSEYNFIDGVVRLQATSGGMRQNIFIGTNWGDQTVGSPGNRGVAGVYASPGGSFQNNLFVCTHEAGNFVPSSVANYAADYTGTVVRSTILGNNILSTAQCSVRRNIFVVHMPYAAQENRQVTIHDSSTASVFGNLDLDENIYVLLDCGTGPVIVGPSQDVTAPPTLVPPANTGGSANAIALTTGLSLVANPGVIVFTASASNTTAVTVNVDGVGAIALKSSTGVDLTAGQIAINTRYAARLISGEYRLLTFQSHVPGINVLRQKTGYEKNGLIIDARGHPMGLNAVFRDYARRDLRLANTDVADEIRRFNAERMKNGLEPCGPSWTINRNVRQLTADDAYKIISRRADYIS